MLLQHALLILLASTEFSIVTSLWGGDRLHWRYYEYSSKSGFGYQYISEFALPVILTYTGAFAVGLFGFAMAIKKGASVVGVLGAILCVIGLFSFALEGSHLVFEHNRSWLAYSPAAMLVLVLIACIPSFRSARANA